MWSVSLTLQMGARLYKRPEHTLISSHFGGKHIAHWNLTNEPTASLFTFATVALLVHDEALWFRILIQTSCWLDERFIQI
jgi:hypothetical protein